MTVSYFRLFDPYGTADREDYEIGVLRAARDEPYQAVGPTWAEWRGWLETMIARGKFERCGPFARIVILDSNV